VISPRNRRVPPPWSEDMEEALMEQTKVMGRRRAGSHPSPLAGILAFIAAAAILTAVLLVLANWP
jgi:hypothetical protein